MGQTERVERLDRDAVIRCEMESSQDSRDRAGRIDRKDIEMIARAQGGFARDVEFYMSLLRGPGAG